jgi:hypothetical protein
MPDPQPSPAPHPGFPYGTVIATLLTLFLFLGLGLLAYRSPNYLGESPADQKTDPATKLNDVKARNQAVLDGNDPNVKMPVSTAAEELRNAADRTKDDAHKHGRLPFPVEPKPADKDKDKDKK